MSGSLQKVGIRLLALSWLLAAGLGATPSQAATPNSLTLEWTATGDDGNAGRANFYVMKYSTVAPGSNPDTWWNSQATQASGLPTPAPSGSNESFEVMGLTPDTQYYFIIRAVDDAGLISDYSNIASGLTMHCDAPTQAPQSLQVGEDAGDALLSWDATADPLAVSIHIYRATGTGGFPSQPLATLNASAVNYRDTSVNPGTTYRYRAAWAASCGDGPSTAEESITMPGSPNSSAASAKPELHAYPNPSSGPVDFVLTVRTTTTVPAKIRLFDITGRWIADILDGSYAPGQTRITWPRTDRGGRAVAPGYYEVIGTVGSERVRERIILLP